MESVVRLKLGGTEDGLMSILGKVNRQNYFEGKTKTIMKVGLNERKRLEAYGSSRSALIGSQ